MMFLTALSTDFMMAANSVDPIRFGKTPFFQFLEVWVISMTLWFIIDEISELRRYSLC